MKLTSRKLAALAVCAWLFYVGKLGEQSFMVVATAYIGAQGLADALKKGKS